jgi:2-polyprenyl-6-methoxyphenol hydroxylase-like FAD-dependent oxidoreductase
LNLSTSDFEVIVGGGPAGATAAYFLGLKGIKTLLIDKSVGSDEVKTVTADDAAAVLTVQDTSYRDGD